MQHGRSLLPRLVWSYGRGICWPTLEDQQLHFCLQRWTRGWPSLRGECVEMIQPVFRENCEVLAL